MSKRPFKGNPHAWRMRIVAWFILALFTVAGIRAFDLQIYKAEEYRKKAKQQYARTLKLLPERGKIYDRNMEELAATVPSSSVFVDSSKVLEQREFFDELCGLLGLNPYDTAKQVQKRGKADTVIKKRISPAEEAEVRKFLARRNPKTKKPYEGSEHVGISPQPMRFYPKKSLAGQLLGFVSPDDVGLSGLEFKYESILKGKEVTYVAERDAGASHLIADAPNSVSAKGQSLVLTIDQDIQHFAEDELVKGVEASGAKGGYAIILDPKTGEILALAQVPRLNPNEYGTVTDPADRNPRSIVEVFEPGSTMKAIFMAVLLDSGKARPFDSVDCNRGLYKVYGHQIHDHVPHGMLTLGEVLKVSSNIGCAKLSQRLRKEEMVDAYRRFGFGERTGIELPGESKGLMQPLKSIVPISQMTMAYGQGIAVTALQMTSALSALANKGERMKPYLVKAVLDSNGNEISRTEPKVAARAVNAEAADTLMRWMSRVVDEEGGTGKLAAGSGYSTAGKTGTAWKPDLKNGGYNRSNVIASFMGVAPVSNPQIAMLVAIDTPTIGSRYGGSISAPVFREITRKVLTHMNVPPDRPEEKPEPEKKPDEEKLAGKDKKKGKEEVDEDTTLAADTDATVELPPGYNSMPDLAGLTMRKALKEIEKTGVSVRLVVKGTGMAVRQSPVPGSAITDGAVCKIEFESPL